MQHGLAFARRQRGKTARVQNRLADIDALARVYRNECVLIEEGWIVIGRLHIATPGNRDKPRTRTGKGLAFHSCEGLLDPGITRPALQSGVAGEKLPQLCGAVLHDRGLCFDNAWSRIQTHQWSKKSIK